MSHQSPGDLRVRSCFLYELLISRVEIAEFVTLLLYFFFVLLGLDLQKSFKREGSNKGGFTKSACLNQSLSQFRC